MAFWSESVLGTPEPKRNYRFLVYVGGFEPWIAKKVTKPSFAISETEHTYINHKFWYPGRVEWNTVECTLVDPGAPDTTQSVWAIIRQAGYTLPLSQTDTRTISKAAAVNSLGMIRIQMIGDQFAGSGDSEVDPVAPRPLATGTEVVEEWVLYNAWIKEVKFGDLDYTNNDLTEVTLTFRYDFAALNADNSPNNVGIQLQGFPSGLNSVQGNTPSGS